jgi:hypothetical protein
MANPTARFLLGFGLALTPVLIWFSWLMSGQLRAWENLHASWIRHTLTLVHAGRFADAAEFQRQTDKIRRSVTQVRLFSIPWALAQRALLTLAGAN